MAKYNKITPEIAEQFKAVVGEQRFSYGEAVNERFSHDEMPIYGKVLPDAVCLVESTEEVSQILKICNDNLIPVTARGAGTGLVGGCVPVCGGLVLCTERMNKILGYDMKNLAVHTQVGVLLKDLAADAESHDLMYPPDPGEKTATLGGNVSTNAGGMRAVKYGVTRDYVLAMTVVLADGEIVKVDSTTFKNSSGYSIRHLMIGSEGTLGIITELTLKLVPRPKMDVSLILPFPDVASCIECVPKIKLAKLDPQSIEYMDSDIIETSTAYTGNRIFPDVCNGEKVGACILVTFVGNSEGELDEKMEALAAVAEDAGALDVLVVDSPNLKKEVWAARSSFLTAINESTKLVDELDVVVPIDQIADFLLFICEQCAELGIETKNYGHAGDGNLHIYTCSNDLPLDEFTRRVEILMERAYPKCAELGGQVSGEHAIGRAKKEYLRVSKGDRMYQLMGQIKKLFDPNEILNPGKVCHDI